MSVPTSSSEAAILALGARITPVILTYNEEPNIGRCLDRLRWARRVVVVDSRSTDRTREICASFANVDWHERTFDSHAAQWNYAVGETKIDTEWILALDADYILTDAFLAELARATRADGPAGYRCRFRYVVFGKTLRASLYPPVTALYRRGRGRYVQDGHTQRVMVDGEVADIGGWIDHDDRKPLARWFASQAKYAALEAEHLLTTPAGELTLADRIRSMGWPAPILVGLYVFFARGCLFDGAAGVYYTLQRVLAEILLALELTDRRFRAFGGGGGANDAHSRT